MLLAGNGEDELMLWPNGAWLCYKTSDPGLSFGGVEKNIESLYLTLRQQLKGPLPKDSEEQKRQRISRIKQYTI